MSNEIECIVDEDGTKFFYKNGKLHNDCEPDVEWIDGVKQYYLNGDELSELEYKKYLIGKEHKEFSANIKNSIKRKKMKV